MCSERVVSDRMERWCSSITRVSQRKLTGVWGCWLIRVCLITSSHLTRGSANTEWVNIHNSRSQ